jgi:2'-5' RNA ligase
MAFLGLQVPHSTARLFSEIEVDGDKTSLDSFHITIMYLGKDVSIDHIADAMKATFEVTSKTKPFSVRTSRVTNFPSNDEGVPIIARVESDALHALRTQLQETYERLGVAYDNKYPNYKPHVTLSYAELEIEEFRIPTLEWGAHELVLWGGDEGDRKLVITFPFSIADKTASKVLDRYVEQQ